MGLTDPCPLTSTNHRVLIHRLDNGVILARNYKCVNCIGDYELVKPIGSGGMAEIWMGRRQSHSGLTKTVAIKLINSHMANDKRYREMFLAEAKLSMLLNHSNIVQVFDAGNQRGSIYMIMEWIDGLNLAQLNGRNRRVGDVFPLSIVGYIMGEILQGLAYAHTLTHAGTAMGIVHRDISPQNVLISLSGEVKLVDFGVARLASDESSGLHIRGKLRYMPPEQIAGRSKSAAIDLFAAGAVLHEMLAGEKFRETNDELELYSRALGGEIPRLRRPDIPPVLLQLHQGLLQPKAQERIASAEEALDLLMSWPGYRNARRQLTPLLQILLGVGAPRSGIHMAVGGSEGANAGGLERPSVPPLRGLSSSNVDVSDGSVTHSRITSPWQAEPARSGAKMFPETLHLSGSGAPDFSRSRLKGCGTLWMKRIMILAVPGLVGFLFLNGKNSVPVGDKTAIEMETDGMEARVPPSPKTALNPASLEMNVNGEEQKVARGAEKANAREKTELLRLYKERALEESDAMEHDSEPGSGRSPKVSANPIKVDAFAKKDFPQKSNKALKPARLQLSLGDFNYLEVKIAGKVHTLDALVHFRLNAGRHRVWIRQQQGEPWVNAGRIRVKPGKSYRLEMLKPHRFKLSEYD